MSRMGRRMSGEGSIYRQKSDGRWFAAISSGPRGARTVVRQSAGKRDNTRAGAKRALDALLAAHAPRSSRMLVSDYLERWLGDYVRRDRIGTSQARNATGIVVHWLKPGLGHLRLDEVRKSDVERLLASVDRSISTRRHVYNVLAVAFDDAVADDLLVANHVRKADRPSGAGADETPWTVEQMSAFLAAARDDWYGPLYVVAASTGLRLSELLGLAWADVDLDAGTANVRVQLARRDGEYVRAPRKAGGKPYAAALPTIAVEALCTVKTRQSSALVFTTERGRAVNASVPTHRMARIAKAAGLPHQDFHGLRRFAGSLWDSVGTLKTTQHQLGHSSERTTSRHYVFTTDEQARAAADAVDALLRRAG